METGKEQNNALKLWLKIESHEDSVYRSLQFMPRGDSPLSPSPIPRITAQNQPKNDGFADKIIPINEYFNI